MNRGMKSGQSCFMVELHKDGMPHWLTFDGTDMVKWTTDPNEALHFADMASADIICQNMDDLDVRITDHEWV